MHKNTIIQLSNPSGFTTYPFSAILRSGARELIEQVIHAELAAFSGGKFGDERSRLVRHGHLPEREVLTGIGLAAANDHISASHMSGSQLR